MLIHLLFAFAATILSLNAAETDQEVPQSWAEQTLASLSLREKIGQTLIVRTVSNFKQSDPGKQYFLDQVWLPTSKHEYIEWLIENYHIGGFLFLMQSTIKKHVEASNRFQSKSKIPLLSVYDAENGLPGLTDAIRFPWNMTLGALQPQDESLIYEMGKEVGRQCRAIGVHFNCAPVVDVNNNYHNPIIAFRAFSDDPETVARKGLLFMHGLQDGGVLACAKHFPGHGDTAYDSHRVLPVITHTKERLEKIELYPFRALIKEKVDSVMTAHLHMPAYDARENRPASLSSIVVTDLLQKELGFDGLIITDALEMAGVTNHFPAGQAELQAFLAGSDLLLCPIDVPKAVDAIEKAVLADSQLQQELDRRVLKILRAKEKLGLHKGCLVSVDEAVAFINRPEAKELKKKLYQKSTTLLSNKDSLLPLSKEIKSLPVLTLIINARESAFAKKLHEEIEGMNVVHLNRETMADDIAQLGIILKQANTVIVGVYGLDWYARSTQHWTRTQKIAYVIGKALGIYAPLQPYAVPPQILKGLSYLQAQNKKLIVSVFGYPYSAQLFGNEDALIMAYEDDIDAQESAAEIILGTLKPAGKLPIDVSKQFSRESGLLL